MTEPASTPDPLEPLEPLAVVLLTTARPVDAAAVGRALARTLGGVPLESARTARYCAGVLLEGAPRSLCERAVSALAEEGMGARVLPAEALPPAPEPRTAVRVEAHEDGLTLTPRKGEPVRIRYADVRLALVLALDAGPTAPRPLDTPEARRRRGIGAGPEVRELDRDPEILVTGEDGVLDREAVRLVGAIGRRRREDRRKTMLFLDLWLRDATRWRLSREDLAEIRLLDPAAPSHGWGAFLALAREAHAAAAAHGARTAPEAEPLLLSGVLAPAVFDEEDELMRYARWLLASDEARPCPAPDPEPDLGGASPAE